MKKPKKHVRKILKRVRLRPLDKRAAKRALWSTISRQLGLMMTIGSGSLLYHMFGSNTTFAVSVAAVLALGGFMSIWFIEYEREVE